MYSFIAFMLIVLLWNQISKILAVAYELLKPVLGPQLDLLMDNVKGKVKTS